MNQHSTTRRRLLAAAGAGLASGYLPQVFGQSYPAKNIHVVVPTRQGGGAERLARSFDEFWGKLLKTHFEYSFYAGAAGQVGYELYVHKRERDAYNLLFGNMGPEMIMYALRNPKYKFPDDYQYFCRMDVDDSVVFVSAKSKYKTIEQLADAAKKGSVNVAVSRLPHPASIGVLALGKAINAKFNLVPYGGGNPTQVAVLNGEAEAGALPVAGVVSLGDQFRVIGAFNDNFKLGSYANNAPSINKVFGTKIPDLPSSRSWAIHTEAINKYPERFALLEKTSRQVFENPAYKEAYKKTGAPVETIQYGDRELCTRYAKAMIELTNEYRSLLTAKSGKK